MLAVALTVGLATLATALMDFRPALDLTKPGIESPFTYSFNRASALGQRWGRDFIATYGPYGYILVTHPVAGLPERRVAFEFARVALAGLAIATFVHSLGLASTGRRLAAAVLLSWVLALQVGEYRWFGVFLFFALASIHLERPWSLAVRALVGLFAGFLLLVKGSIGAAAVLTALALLFAGPFGAGAVWALTVTLAGIAVGASAAWVAHQGTLAGLWTSLRLTAEIAGGYSGTVGLDPEGGWRDIAWFLGFAVAFATGVALEGSRRVFRSLVAFAVPLFVVWKHAFVRQDATHTAVLLPFGLLITLLLVSDSLVQPGSRRGLPVLLGAWLLLIPVAIHVGQRSTVFEQLVRPWNGGGWDYLRLLPTFDDYHRKAWRMSKRLLEPLVLPEDVRAEIGQSSIDVYPRNLSVVAANPDLNWTVRPSPTSYGNYRPTLDDLNAQFFASERRPEYLLWHWEEEQAIDGRNVLWDEPLTLRTIFQRYDVVREEPLLLRAGPPHRFLKEEPLGEAAVAWDAWTPVPATSGPLFIRATIEPSILRSAARLLFRENPIFLDLQLDSGEVLSYRLAPDNAPSGLWIQPPISGPADIRRALNTEPERRTVMAMRFRGERATQTAGPIPVSWTTFR